MSSPEYIFRPREVNAPVDKTGGSPMSPTPAENPVQGSLPKVPDIGQTLSTAQELPIHNIKKARRVFWEQTGYIPSIAGGALNKPTGTQKSENNKSNELVDPEKIHREDYVRVLNLGLNRDEDLSPDANQLVYLMLLDEDNVEELRQEFAREGRNFQAAYDELDGHGLIVKRQAGRIQLPYQLIPEKGEESNPDEI